MTTEHHDVRQHILDTGKSIIIGKGYSAVGLNEILSAAGVPKGSFYHYFKSKELFGEALLESYVADYLVRLDALLSEPGYTAAQRLMRYWEGWIETQGGDCTVDKCLVVKLSGEVSDMSEAMRMVLLKGTNLIIERLAECLLEALAEGSLQGEFDASHTALTLYQIWLGAALLSKLRRDSSALESAMRATLTLLNLPLQSAH